MQDYWFKQEHSNPMFPDLVWSRPEAKQTAGKLLIIGGNIHGFSAVGTAYSEAVKAGIGIARIILPDALQKTVGKMLPEAIFAPSAPSGSFGQKALAELLESSNWADGVLVAGDLGRNSETAIVLEKFVGKYSGQLTLAKDTVDYFSRSVEAIKDRPKTTLVLSMAQLQQLASSLKFKIAFTFDMNLINLVDALHEFSQTYGFNIILKHLDTIFVATKGQISSTKSDQTEGAWRVPTAAHAAVWWLQNPSKTFEALTTAVTKSE
ncbi:MAG TPA: hypothetical protein VJC09_02425 [Candidatus Saccharimonadales bacterium]|nr:hypothetical protein [Candidatus Saccharimonadales bacterium]